ncbi:MAG: energy-coupling factor transporter transmembrane protein EcfT [Chloroflexi bacterium]|nr:energy-coupling factor transporter transmembrane protein EcfT [Chloroflexota bacterium]
MSNENPRLSGATPETGSRSPAPSINLDPRAKLILVLAFSVLIIRTGHVGWLWAEVGVIVICILAVREGWAYLRWLRPVSALVASWFIISWWAFDLPAAVSASLRLLALTSAFFLFFRATAPEDLGNALVKSGVPYSFAFVLVTSMQFVPIINRKVQNIVDAQRSRGIPLELGLGLIWPSASMRRQSKVPPILALLAPLLIQAFQLADDLAEAMEARGFGREGRTFIQDYQPGMADWLVVAGAGIILLVAGTGISG